MAIQIGIISKGTVKGVAEQENLTSTQNIFFSYHLVTPPLLLYMVYLGHMPMLFKEK